MSNLLARNDFESIKAYLKNYAQCLEQGGYNAIKYYLVLDEGDIDVKLAPWEADDKISQLKAMVEEYDRLKTPALMRQAEQIVEIEKKRDAQSQDSTLPQEEMKPKKKRKIPFTDWLEKRDATEARQTNR